jgi:phospholipid/cholesterol/gamma-HCH transport system substrate-binding protein
MNEPPPPATDAPGAESLPPVRNLELKAALLLLFLFSLVVGSAAYLMYARGVFEPTQQLVLVAEDSEGVVVGMDLTFAGFAIGRVARIELGEDGNARILIDVPRKDVRWLRSSSVFTMERGLVGATRIRAFTGVLDDPPLEDGAVRPVLRGDALASLPEIAIAVHELLANLRAITAEDAALIASLANLQRVAEKLKGPQGALAVLFGSDAEARQLVGRTNALLARADALAARLDRLAVNADRQLFGQPVGPAGTTGTARPGGLVSETRATVGELNGLLVDARSSLQRVDALLLEVHGIAGNTRAATTDLGALRSEVDATLRKVQHLINEVNRRWPFARDNEIELP